MNHGEFCHHGSQHIAPYTVGERLAIQYDPKKPAAITSVAPARTTKSWKQSW